ncbi:MAG: tRNA pseudouridine(38-40) synthase TruA [Cyclobacteriaceae bacterium]|nr:tRNA pseudouridine(38-40) synthase TruA [Cyclobacteriaceae bacterium]
MQNNPHIYLFSVAYFGARYKGWAIQKGQPTIQGKLERVFRYVLGHEDFKLLGASRTDSGVSCRKAYFQIFLKESFNIKGKVQLINSYLGGEIQIEFLGLCRPEFNLIQAARKKTYRYFFTDDENPHPFSSSFLVSLFSQIDIQKMRLAANQFVGTHDFFAFCKPSDTKSDYSRTILHCDIALAKETPWVDLGERVYMLEVIGTGFLYHQVRKMMQAIWNVGLGEWELEDLNKRLEEPYQGWGKIPPAPAFGLFLWDTELQEEWRLEEN